MVIAVKVQASASKSAADNPSPIFLGRRTEFVPAGGIICEEQTPATHFYEIASGCVRVYKLLQNGRRAIISFRFKNDFLGRFFNYPTYLYTADAVTDVEMRRVSHAELREILSRRPELGSVLMSWAAESMIAAQDHIVALGCKTAVESIAHFLVTVARKHFKTDDAVEELKLPLNRTDIADFLGLTMESVSRALTRLKNEGLIATSPTRELRLRNIATLAAIAGLQYSNDAADVANSDHGAGRPKSTYLT